MSTSETTSAGSFDRYVTVTVAALEPPKLVTSGKSTSCNDTVRGGGDGTVVDEVVVAEFVGALFVGCEVVGGELVGATLVCPTL